MTVAVNIAPWKTKGRLRVLFSSYGDPDELIKHIDCECCPHLRRWIRGRPPRGFRGYNNYHAILTASWLLVFEPKDFWIVRVPDVLWAFKRVIAKPAWWGGERLIFQVCCVMKMVRIYFVPMPNESWADEVLQELIERRPAALFGDRGEWRDLAARGRRAMQAEIARRREEWERLDEEGRDDWHFDRLNDAENFVHRVDPQAPDDGGVKIGPN